MANSGDHWPDASCDALAAVRKKIAANAKATSVIVFVFDDAPKNAAAQVRE